jgi:RNA methyltransferase, TrmH family
MKITESPVIASKDNPRVKLVRSARDGRNKSAIFVEGARLTSELLKSEIKVTTIFVSDDSVEKLGTLVSELASAKEADVLIVASKIFASITDTDNSQGIVVLAERPQMRSIDELTVGAETIVYLSQVNNPSNIGAVIRTAEAAGPAALVTSPRSADAFSPKSLRASMGSAFRMPIYPEVKMGDAIAFARSHGIRTLAADINGEKCYTKADLRGRTMFVFGSEAHGLEDRELELMDETVRIEMESGVESLNLAVSAGILLFEAKRQRECS